MGSQHATSIKAAAIVLGMAALASCGPKSTPPPPPPPPPPPVVYVPPRPLPPLGAAAAMFVPPVGPDGVRQTVNAHLSPAQSVWNLRSAYNVAALNCLKPQHVDILAGYKAFLKVQKKGLLAANTSVDAEFRKKYGAAFIRPREAYMTQVYNYYAFPATIDRFCDAVLAVAHESMVLKPAELTAFAQRSVPAIDTVFEGFYRSFEQYMADAATWDARYAPKPVATVTTTLVPPVTTK